MMMKRNLALFLLLFLLVSFSLLAGSESWPVVHGTFIQEWLTVNWSVKEWDRELAYLKEVGMKYLIIAPTGFGMDDQPGLQTIYPSSIESWVEYAPGVDLVENTLNAAQRAGMQVILGLNMHDLWWQKGVKDPEWLYEQVELGNILAEDIYQRYYSRYKDTICGWYFVWEIDNLMAQNKNAVEVLATAFNKQIDFLNELDPSLFFIWSPYMNSKLATKEAYRDFWIDLFKEVHFRVGDVFCPMDCVGAGGTTVDNVAEWFAEFRKAVDTKPGLKFWSNAENFDYRDWTSAPVNRFIHQLQLVEGYVDDFITFAYPHYYSPNIIDKGYHDTYLQYVKTGETDNISPKPPANFQMIEMPDGSVFLRWDDGEDNVGIAGYIIYRNGVNIGRTQVPRTNTSGYVNAFKEQGLRSGRRYTYIIYAYDFAGNISEPSEEFVLEL